MNKPFLVPRVLEDDEDFPISPFDIDIDIRKEENLVGAFDLPGEENDHPDNIRYWNEKLNEGATIIVWACQKQGSWGPCNPHKLIYGHEEGTFSLNHFLHDKHPFKGLVVRGEDGLCRVTNAFIIYCYLAAPKIRKKQPALAAAVPAIESAT
jgi:hypothetical protein